MYLHCFLILRQNGCYEIWVNDTTNTVNEIVKWVVWDREMIFPDAWIQAVVIGTDKTGIFDHIEPVGELTL